MAESDTAGAVTGDRGGPSSSWERSGWFADGLRTYPVAVGALLIWGVVELSVDLGPLTSSPGWWRAVVVAAVGALALLALALVRWILTRRGVLVDAREGAARLTVAAYVPLAAALAAVDMASYTLGLAGAALAMTAPGVLLTVLDGSPPVRAALRVLLAAVLVPVAYVAGMVVGFLAFFVSTIFGSLVAGVLAGHLVTFVPLAMIGPGRTCHHAREGEEAHGDRGRRR